MAPLARGRIARLDGGSFRLRYVHDCVKRSPTSVAELGAWLVSHSATGWTRRKRKGRAALAAKPGTFAIFCPAFGTAHVPLAFSRSTRPQTYSSANPT